MAAQADPAKNGSERDRSWPLFCSFAGYTRADLSRDLIAGLTLAAIAIPGQMATARLGGLPPAIGFFAFIAATIAFAAFGASRFLVAGADTTITPIFASGLAMLAATSTTNYAALAAILALMVGVILIAGGLLRLGWIADLLSAPVITGFLAGIAVHIVVSQMPSIFGLQPASGSLIRQVATLASELKSTNLITLGLGLGVFALTFGSEKLHARIPGALIGLVVAVAAVMIFGLESRGVAVLGTVGDALPHLSMPAVAIDTVVPIVPLALVIALVVMVQTAATTRATPSDPDAPPNVNRDFVGIGAGSLLAGFVGAFPVNASPPSTAIVAESGGRTQLAGLVAAAIILGLILFGAPLLAHIPQAALSGVLLFIAVRIVRFGEMIAVFKAARGEAALIAATLVAIIVLPIEIGVGVGIVLSLLHGLWSATRAQVIEYMHIPNSSIWWPPTLKENGETLPGILVVAFQAPLSFLNAADFEHTLFVALRNRPDPIALLILEAGNIIDMDYTAAQVLLSVIDKIQRSGITMAIARLESRRAQAAFARFGIDDRLGANRVFQSVQEAVTALGHR